MQKLYTVNFKKVKNGCRDKWFGSLNVEDETSPNSISINSEEPFHFLQILFLLKESLWNDKRWCAFTMKDLNDLVKDSKQIYLEKYMFGNDFYNEFPIQIKNFIEIYCDEIGQY